MRPAWGALLVGLVLVLGCSAPASAPAPPTTAPAATSAPAVTSVPAGAAAPTTQPTGAPAAAKPPAAVAAPVPTAAATTIKVGLVAGTGASPIFVAQGRGYFQQQGLNVQFVTVSSGAELLPLMASNQLDAGISSPGAALFNAIGTNVLLKAVADAGRDEPGYFWGGVVVRSDLLDSGAIKTPADLKGKNIAVTAPGVGTYMNMVTLLENNGLTDKDANITFMNFGDMLSALASKSIDAADMVEPVITQGESQGVLKRWISNAEIAPGEQEVVLMITPQLAAKQDVADRLLVAYVQGIHDYQAAFGPEKTDQAAVISAVMPMLPSSYTPELVAKIMPLALDPDGLVNGDSLKHQQDWYAAHGFIKTPVDIDKVVDNTFAEHAKATLGAQH